MSRNTPSDRAVDTKASGHLRRRTLLAAGVAATGLATTHAIPAQEPASGAKGPPVWLDMDQAQLDAAYDQGVYAPNLRQVLDRYRLNSGLARTRVGEPLRFAYGRTPIEQLDVYRTARPNAPIHVFIHGGAWRGERARDYEFIAEMFIHAGAHYVVPDFTTVTASGGDLMPLAQQVRSAVAWVYRHAGQLGGDPNRIFVSGHSSGGHLAGVILTTDWRGEFGLPMDVVKGGLCCSGMFDLRPVALSARREYINFTGAMEQALSPQRHLDMLTAPVIVACGSLETPEFLRQSRDFAAAVVAAGKPAQLLLAEGYNHFEILETLASPYGHLGRAVLEQMHAGHG